MLQINRPLGLGELLDGAFRIYRAHFARLVLTAAIFLVPVGVLSTLLLGATVGSFTELLLAAGGEPIDSEFDPGLGAVGAYLLTGLLGYLASGLTYVSLTSQVAGLLQGKDLTAGASIRRGARRLLPFIGMVLLAGLAVVGLLLALYIVLFFVVFAMAMALGAIGAIGEGSGMGAAAVALAVVVFVFYMAAIVAVFIPIGLLLARWVAAPTLVVAESLGPVASLSRSWQLTRNNLWRTFGYLALLAIFNFVVLGLPLAVLQWLLIFALTTQWYGWLSGLLIGLSYLINVLWIPFMVLALVIFYFDLRVRNESLDLELRVRQLEESTRPGTLPS
jgi:hypothetical protein